MEWRCFVIYLSNDDPRRSVDIVASARCLYGGRQVVSTRHVSSAAWIFQQQSIRREYSSWLHSAHHSVTSLTMQQRRSSI